MHYNIYNNEQFSAGVIYNPVCVCSEESRICLCYPGTMPFITLCTCVYFMFVSMVLNIIIPRIFHNKYITFSPTFHIFHHSLASWVTRSDSKSRLTYGQRVTDTANSFFVKWACKTIHLSTLDPLPKVTLQGFVGPDCNRVIGVVTNREEPFVLVTCRDRTLSLIDTESRHKWWSTISQCVKIEVRLDHEFNDHNAEKKNRPRSDSKSRLTYGQRECFYPSRTISHQTMNRSFENIVAACYHVPALFSLSRLSPLKIGSFVSRTPETPQVFWVERGSCLVTRLAERFERTLRDPGAGQ